MGNECSESMREMRGRVSFSVWGLCSGLCLTKRLECTGTERETAHHGTASLSHSPFLLSCFFLFPLLYSPIVLFLSFYLLPPFLCSLTALSLLKPPQAGLLDRNKRLMSLFMWLRTSQATAPAKEQPGTMETAWSRHRAGLMRKPPSCKKSLQEISSHAPLLYRQELWDYIFIPNPG